MIPIPWKERPSETLRVIQISDLHLFADPAHEFCGIDPFANLQTVLEEITQWQPDRVIVTGDLIHDENPTTYQRLRDLLNHLSCPVHVLPGNHDKPELMRTHLVGGNVLYEPFSTTAYWGMAFLDTTVNGQEYGQVSDEQLGHLTDYANTQPDLPLLVAMHHQPIDIDSPWMDAIGLKGRARFLNTLNQLPQKITVIFGHIHQPFEYITKNRKYLGAPATSIQFQPNTLTSTIEHNSPPGFRWLLLNPTSKAQSGINRIDHK